MGTRVSQEGTGHGRGGRDAGTHTRHSGRGLTASSPPAGSVSISNLYPGCEHVSVRSRSMMLEPGLTRGTLEVVVASPQHPIARPMTSPPRPSTSRTLSERYSSPSTPQVACPVSLCPDCKSSPRGSLSRCMCHSPTKDRGRAAQRDLGMTQ